MATPTQNLSVQIGGVLHPSLRGAFNSLAGMVATAENRIRALTGQMNVNTSSQQRNATAATATTRAQAAQTSQTARLTQQHRQNASAVNQNAQAYNVLQRSMQATGRYLQSDAFSRHQQGLGLSAVAAGAAIPLAARPGADLEDQLIQAIITTGSASTALDPTRQAISGLANRDQTGQTMGSLAEGLSVFTAANMNLDESLARLKGAGRVATATGSSVSDIARTELAMKTMFGISGDTAEETAKRTQRAWNILATAGKEGSFELKNMAQEMTEVGSRAASMGMTGERNLAFVGASLQAQVKNAGDPRTAANNMVNFMDKLNGAPDFMENAKKLGIDITNLKRQAIENGPDGANIMELFVAEFQKVMDRTPEAQRGAVMGQLVQDRQAREGLKAQLMNAKMIAEIQKQGLEMADKDVISEDYEKAIISSKVAWQSINASMEKFGQAATVAFAPTLVWFAKIAEKGSNFLLALTTSKKEIAGMAYPVLTLLGGFMGLGLKARLLGRILTGIGMTRWGTLLGNFPTLRGAFTGLFGLIRSGVTKLAPLGARAGTLFLTGMRFVLVRGLALLLGTTLGAVITTAIVGFGIGTLLGNILKEPLADWWAQFTGMKAQLDAMKKPAVDSGFSPTSLANLAGDAGQQARLAAIEKASKSIEANRAKLEAKEKETFIGDADKIEIAQLRDQIRLAEAAKTNIQQQITRVKAGEGAIGNSPEAIKAAKERMAHYDSVVSSGKDEGSLTVADARAYADGLRAQLVAAEAKETALKGSSNSSTSTTTLNVNVSGATADGAGKAVASAVADALRERDREIARGYRGAVSTGNLGE